MEQLELLFRDISALPVLKRFTQDRGTYLKQGQITGNYMSLFQTCSPNEYVNS